MFWLLAFLQIRKKSGRQGTDLAKIKLANGLNPLNYANSPKIRKNKFN